MFTLSGYLISKKIQNRSTPVDAFPDTLHLKIEQLKKSEPNVVFFVLHTGTYFGK